MVAIKKILLFVTAANALTIGKRTAATIEKDISTIDSDVKTLTTATNNYNGGLINALPVANDEMTLDQDIKQGTTDAKATSKLSSADSSAVISAIKKLEPDIQAALKALVDKKANFAADGLTSTVQDDLATLKKDTDAFADALIAIASSDTTAQGNSAKSTIDGYFTDAINSFAS